MAIRFHPGRISAAALGASIALMSVAPAALADNDNYGHATPRGPRDVQADKSIPTNGLNVALKGDKYATEKTLLIPITVDGQKILTYCVELNVDIQNGVKMVEVPWGQYPYDAAHPRSGFKANSGKINWILQNSYPNVSPGALNSVLTRAGAKLDHNLTSAEAITATQAAIWNLSDGAEVDESNPTPYDHADGSDVLAVYHWLLDNAKQIDEPTPGLDLSPTSVTGKAGDLIGPFTVKTTANSVTVTSTLPGGVTLTDKDGKALGTVSDGTQIYVKAPADQAAGNGGFSLDASAHLKAGRLFIGADASGQPSETAITQSLIVAKPTDVKLHKDATVSWTAATLVTTAPPTTTTPTTPPCTTTPGGGTTTTTPMSPTCATPTTAPPATGTPTTPLAYTGASVIGPIIVGLVLIGAGAGALLFVRRRKAKTN
jgi:TQXA domain-containing protein/LPXTG-motif cell wall-anchored protein